MGRRLLLEERPVAPAVRLLNATQAARYCGIGRSRFHRILAAGVGPRPFNPDGGRRLFATSVLDAWMTGADRVA